MWELSPTGYDKFFSLIAIESMRVSDNSFCVSHVALIKVLLNVLSGCVNPFCKSD